jgi:hypothetical protein
MAHYIIAEVHRGPVYAPTEHQHIETVRLTTGTVITRGQVIAMLRAGDLFTTNATPPGYVYEHNCPHCGTGDYITTHPDATKTNNLLDLPRF